MNKLSILGAEISSLKKSEDCGGLYYYDDGTQADALEILKDHGMNYACIHVWVKTPDGYRCGWEQLGKPGIVRY